MSHKKKDFNPQVNTEATETQEETVAQDVPVVEAKPLVNIEPVTEEQQKKMQTYLGRSVVVNNHLTTIRDYCVKMKPGNAVTPKLGAEWTQKLYAAIMGLISLENVGEMVDGLDETLALFKEHANGALNMTYTQRFIEFWVVDENRRDLFSNLCYMLNTYSDVDRNNKKIKAMQLDNMEGALKHMLPTIRERFVSYLKRYVS